MADETVKVPIVAHRIFGTTTTPEKRAPRRRALPYERPWGPTPRRREASNQPRVDTGHGTRRPLDEIKALFQSSPSLPIAEGLSVNSLTEPFLAFELREIVDHMAASHIADFVPDGWSFAHFNRPGSINVYFVRELEAAFGRATREADALYVADRYDDEPFMTPHERWQHDVITTAHELGHLFGLLHVPHIENTMFGYGTQTESNAFEPPQLRIMQHQAQGFLTEQELLEITHLLADWLRDRPFDFDLFLGGSDE